MRSCTKPPPSTTLAVPARPRTQDDDLRPHPVVVAVDGSAGSLSACRYAAQEAVRLGADVLLVHAVPASIPWSPTLVAVLPEGSEKSGLDLLRAAMDVVSAAAPDLRVHSRLVHGPSVSSIAHLVDDASVLVLGRDRSGIAETIWGGRVGTGLTERATCPVVSVPQHWLPGAEHGHVVVGVRSARGSTPFLAEALAVAAARRTDLVVAHAWEIPSPYDNMIADSLNRAEWSRNASRDLTSTLEALRGRHPEVALSIRLLVEPPATALVAEATGADLLILERHGHTRLSSLNLGPTSRAVLSESACPVMMLAPAPQTP